MFCRPVLILSSLPSVVAAIRSSGVVPSKFCAKIGQATLASAIANANFFIIVVIIMYVYVRFLSRSVGKFTILFSNSNRQQEGIFLTENEKSLFVFSCMQI